MGYSKADHSKAARQYADILFDLLTQSKHGGTVRSPEVGNVAAQLVMADAIYALAAAVSDVEATVEAHLKGGAR